MNLLLRIPGAKWPLGWTIHNHSGACVCVCVFSSEDYSFHTCISPAPGEHKRLRHQMALSLTPTGGAERGLGASLLSVEAVFSPTVMVFCLTNAGPGGEREKVLLTGRARLSLFIPLSSDPSPV